MKIQSHKSLQFRGQVKPLFSTRGIKSFFQTISNKLYKFRASIYAVMLSTWHYIFRVLQKNKTNGLTLAMDDYEKRKLGIFNQLNLFQIITGIVVPVIVILSDNNLAPVSAFIIISPPLISLLVLYLNSKKKHTEAMISYFVLYPFFTSLAYISGINLGLELFFVLYGILSVFFLKELSQIVFCISFNMVNYFMLAVVLKKYQYHLEFTHPFFYLLNHLMAIAFIFYGLYLIKKENAGYQSGILEKNNELHLINEEVKKQKEEIGEKARQLEQHTARLNEVDEFKNRLFSIVSHDLKTPLYALRNLFTELQAKRISAKEMNELVPQVVKDLHYATGLTDNLLHWAKSQMHSGAAYPQVLNVSGIIGEIVQQQRLQAELKEIQINARLEEAFYIYADMDMISLVIRNLLSNAIKFTPRQGSVSIGANETGSYIEIYITDTGAGMETDVLEKIRSNSYYSSRGTANEPGTGLGLMLCKDFLVKNNGQLHIESTPGQGSTFSFTLPKAKR